MQNQTLSHPENIDRIKSVLDAISIACCEMGVPFQPYSVDSLSIFSALPFSQRQRIEGEIVDYGRVIKKINDSGVNITDDESVEDEKQFLNTALDVFSMRAPKNENFNFIKPGWVIEIYNLEMRQLYRNFVFLRQCSYDFLTLCTIEWPLLYNRPDHITQKMLGHFPQLMAAEGTIPYQDVPKHILTERYLSHNRAFINDKKYLSPLFDVKYEKKCGFINFVESIPVPLDTGNVTTLM